MPQVNDLILTVSNVLCFKEGKQQAAASGFFYSDKSGRIYLITNRHVVIDEDNNYFPDELRLRLHTNINDITQNDDYSISLYDENNRRPRWLEHPGGNREIDVVAVPLSADLSPHFIVKSFNEGAHIPTDVNIAVGEDVLVIGYPLGFYDTLHNLPIVRNAVMASIYPVPFQGRPMILIDARLHSGTSGSPVITKTTNTVFRTDGSTRIMSRTVIFLVGIHSASLDIKRRDPIHDEPLGLNAVWFASLIPQIIQQSG